MFEEENSKLKSVCVSVGGVILRKSSDVEVKLSKQHEEDLVN